MTNPLVEERHKQIADEQALQLRVEGETRGRAVSLIRVLEVRGLPVNELLHTRIRHASIEQLDDWLSKAATANAITEVFQDD